MLAKRGWLGHDATLAFTIAAALLAWPAVALPLATVSKLRQEHAGFVITGVRALWQDNMHLLSIWVLLCGTLAPFGLLAILVLLQTPPRFRPLVPSARWLGRAAGALEQWAMPEVHVLALLVAFSKLDAIVNVKLGTGFWCYAAMGLMLLLAWRSFDYDLPIEGPLSEPREVPVPP
jgi:paraquat-inducible protein A